MAEQEEFEIIVEVPKNFHFNGVVPYDMQIIAGQAFVSVPAMNMEEAYKKAMEFFHG